MYKILLGVPSMIVNPEIVSEDGCIRNYEVDEEMDIWCDFELNYYPEEKVYQFSFETMLGFGTDDGARNWLIKCLSKLTDYMNENGYDTSYELNMYKVFTEGVNVNTAFESIEEAYAWFKMMIFGFYGKGLN